MSTNIYDECAQQAWEAVISKVKALDASGVKRTEISRMLGHKGRSAVSNWLGENPPSMNATFSDMLRYLDVLGLNIYDYIPQPREPQPPSGEIMERMEKLRIDRDELRGQVKLLTTWLEKEQAKNRELELDIRQAKDAVDSEADNKRKTLKAV